jgi:DNA-binding NarL/FixJ family response regulator
MKKILLVDDHPLLREGLRRLIVTDHSLTVCGVAANVEDALVLVESSKPDLVLTDLTLPGRDGMELIKDLKATHPEIPVMVLSMHDENVHAKRVLLAGGCGYVMKDISPKRLVEAIHIVLGGGVFTNQPVSNHAATRHPRTAHPGTPATRVTSR